MSTSNIPVKSFKNMSMIGVLPSNKIMKAFKKIPITDAITDDIINDIIDDTPSDKIIKAFEKIPITDNIIMKNCTSNKVNNILDVLFYTIIS